MTNQSIATALTLGFLAFIFSTLPVTTAEADCVERTMSWQHHCLPGETESSRDCVEPDCRFYVFTCCTTPSEPYAKGSYKEHSTETPPSRDPALDCPSGKYDYAAKRCIKPVKEIGKGSSSGKGNAALKRACEAKGWRYEEHPAKCLKPSQVKADCDAKGPNYTYDLDTGGCVKAIEKVEPLKPSQRKAACEAKGPNYSYDLDTGGCVKAIAKSQEGSE